MLLLDIRKRCNTRISEVPTEPAVFSGNSKTPARRLLPELAPLQGMQNLSRGFMVFRV